MLHNLSSMQRAGAVLLLALWPTSFALTAQTTQPVIPASPTLARVIAKEAALRCFATTKSPVFADILREGDVVVVGPAAGEFRTVTLPLGPTGYVAKKYSTEPKDGLVATSGSDVAFRYRVPKGVEAPVQQLPKDATLHLLGDEGDWWRVRSPGSSAYVLESEVQILAGEPAAAEAALRATEGRRQREWQDAVATFAQAAAARRAVQERKTQVDGLMTRFRAETVKPAEQQEYAALLAEARTLAPALPADSDEATRLALLIDSIQKQMTVVEAMVALKKEAPVVEIQPTGKAPEPDALERFEAIGWLRPRKGPGAQYQIEKGGRVLYLVDCRSGRYDLGMFVDTEVGVIGTADRPQRESIRVLEAQKIEVISARPR